MRAPTHPGEGAQPEPFDRFVRWRDAVESCPVPTLIVSGGPSPTDLGLIAYCNAAARSRFHLHSATVSPRQSLFDLVTQGDHVLVAAILADPAADSRPIEIDITADAAPGPDPSQKRHGARFGLHLQSLDDEQFVVQLVGSDGWRAANEALAEQHRFRAALMELSDLAHATHDDDEFYQRLLERAVDVVPGAQGGSVQLGVPGTTSFRFVGAVGYDLAGLQEHLLDRADFFRDTIDPKAQIVRQFDNSRRSQETVEWLETVGRVSQIVVNVSAPVVVAGEPIAFLSLDNFEDPSAITETSVEMTTVLSRLIGDLWLRRRLESQLRKEREAFRHQALHDALTGAANRRHLDDAVREMVATNQQLHAPSAVLFVDVDDFKGVNDRLGHNTGDLRLIAVADGLKAVVGDAGLVGRWGGDEFLVIPAQAGSCEQMQQLAVDILHHFETDVQLAETHYRARLSLGIGWSANSATGGADLVRAGDEALYQAKAAGKGTVRLREC